MGLAALVAVLVVLTRPLVHTSRIDTVEVQLGALPAAAPRARNVDMHVLHAIASSAFGDELRRRLDHPAKIVWLDSFFLDRCEVRQIDFERFAGWHKMQGLGGTSANLPGSRPFPGELVSTSTGHAIAGQLKSPATGVDFEAARRYCIKAGGRLPWAEELEAAAAGRKGRLYAWGDEFDSGAWPYPDPLRNAARRCGSHGAADSPEGVHDLNTNAMEWSAGSLAVPVAGNRLPSVHGAPPDRVRGRALYSLNSAWVPVDPTTRSHYLGFRCAYDERPRSGLPWGNPAREVVRIEGGEFPIGLPLGVRLAPYAVARSNEALRASRSAFSSSDGGARTDSGRAVRGEPARVQGISP